jgi:hypothetical protein
MHDPFLETVVATLLQTTIHMGEQDRNRRADSEASLIGTSVRHCCRSTHQAVVTERGDLDRPRETCGYLFARPTTAARPGLVEVTGGVARIAAPDSGLVWLSSGMCPAGHRGAERLKRGLPSSK